MDQRQGKSILKMGRLPMVESIMCDGCGHQRQWQGMELLSSCPCLEKGNEEDINVIDPNNTLPRKREIIAMDLSLKHQMIENSVALTR